MLKVSLGMAMNHLNFLNELQNGPTDMASNMR